MKISMKILQYDRTLAKRICKKMGIPKRNPEYYNYDDVIGGDCTNFVSQCLFYGSKVMNYNQNGWYYNRRKW